MPWQRGAAAAGQQPEAIVQMCRNRLDAEGRRARRGQLDRQRNAVKPPANCRDDGRAMPIFRHLRPARAGSSEEQKNGAVSEKIALFRGMLLRYGERRHRVELLRLGPERLAAGGDDVDRRAGPKQRLGERRSGFDHMLASIQHQEQAPLAERLSDALRRYLAGTELKPGCRGYRRGKQAGVGNRRQLGKPDAVTKLRQ